MNGLNYQQEILEDYGTNPYPTFENNILPSPRMFSCSLCKKDTPETESKLCSFRLNPNNQNDVPCQEVYCSDDCLLKDYLHHHKHYKEIFQEYKTYNKQKLGIMNEGNTCFINSMIQQLSNMFFLSIYYQGNYYKEHLQKTGQLSDSISNVFKLLRSKISSHDRFIEIKNFFNVLITLFPVYAKKEQHDANEFLIYLMDGLKNELNNDLNLQKLINGEYKSTITTFNKTTNQPKEQIKAEKFFLLFLPIIIKEYIYCFNVERKEFYKYNVFSDVSNIQVRELFEKLRSYYGKNTDNLIVYRIIDSQGFTFFSLEEKDEVCMYSGQHNPSDGCKYIIYEFEEPVQNIFKHNKKEVNNNSNQINNNNELIQPEKKVIVFILLKRKSNKFLNFFSSNMVTKYPFCFLEKEGTTLAEIRNKLITFLKTLANHVTFTLFPDKIIQNNIENTYSFEMNSLTLKQVLSENNNNSSSKTTCILSYICENEEIINKLITKVFYEDTRGKNTVLLEECLAQFFSRKRIKNNIQSSNIIKFSKYTLQKLPFYLLIYLQRDKILTEKSISCKYPTELDITKYVENDIYEHFQKKPIIYELIGVNKHGGFTKYRGHYVCTLFFDSEKKWYEFSDKSVTLCKNIQSTDAVFLVYRQKVEGIEYLNY